MTDYLVPVPRASYHAHAERANELSTLVFYLTPRYQLSYAPTISVAVAHTA